MCTSGKKNRLARQKKNILTLVLSEKKILNETKNHNPFLPPPFKLNGRSLIPYQNCIVCFCECKYEGTINTKIIEQNENRRYESYIY
jgi:hypothetical protein